ncbi:MAG: nicotinate-nucleotide--dimethylbenzimidazole phosphoribosyltransferase [Lachnospiraceae bacterium]|nr:nicotinate-nucleotide--dimethylbenzimidazole phosphoribosyltransferase [Lachnospiraceae bacterium]
MENLYKLEKVIKGIKAPDNEVFMESRKHWDSLAKPLHSLGDLEDIISKIASIKGDLDISLEKALLLVYCSDNGVIEEGVSQSDSGVTLKVAKAIAAGNSTVNHLAGEKRIDILAVDVGMKHEAEGEVSDLSSILKGEKAILKRRIGSGSKNFLKEPAMTRDECIKALITGIDLVEALKKEGYDILLTGEMGIGNTTTQTALTSVLLKKDPEFFTGPGAGLDKEGMKRKLKTIRQGISLYSPDPSDPIDLMAKLGGFDIAALCGSFLGAAYYKLPVIIDGVITLAAALCAKSLAKKSVDYMIASHKSGVAGIEEIFKELKLKPVIDANMHLGEGGGGVMLIPLLDSALRLYKSGHYFSELGIEPYIHLN